MIILLRFVYRTLKEFAKALGFNIVVTKKNKNAADYESILHSATYAPWLSDRSFHETHKIINNYTLIDEYRCYELWQLVKESAKLRGALIEIGVWKGGSGVLIAKKAKLMRIKDKVYLCDTFMGVVKTGEKDLHYKGREHADCSKEEVEKLINILKLDNTKILTGIFPEETSKLITDKTFRFCHIDVDVYESAKDILQWIWPKLVVGGIVIFDDYGFESCNGITSLVNKQRGKKDKMVIHNLNGHAILVKLS